MTKAPILAYRWDELTTRIYLLIVRNQLHKTDKPKINKSKVDQFSTFMISSARNHFLDNQQEFFLNISENKFLSGWGTSKRINQLCLSNLSHLDK